MHPSIGERSYDLVIRGGTVVLPGTGVVEGDIAIRDGKIAALLSAGARADSVEQISARGLYVLPGAVDTHTHWGYRGDFETQCRSDSRAAALGGTTTAHLLHRMQPKEFAQTIGTAEAVSAIDFAVTPAVFNDATASAVRSNAENWGCPSAKFYLAYKAIPGAQSDDDWNMLTDGMMLASMQELARHQGAMAFVHAENADIINHSLAAVRGRSDTRGLPAWDEANPPVAEVEAILRAGMLAEHAGLPVYFVHLSGREAVRALVRVKERWPAAYGETCPHYLVLNVESGPDIAKFSPPVRHREDNEYLWRAVADGTISCIGSDNSSCQLESKQGEIWDIVRGGPGAGTLLPIILSEGVNARRITLERAVEVTSTTAARLLGLFPQKGTIAIGSDADLAIVDLKATRAVSDTMLGTWSDFNLYDGQKFAGWPVFTVLRGRIVVRDGALADPGGVGKFLRRPVQPSGGEDA